MRSGTEIIKIALVTGCDTEAEWFYHDATVLWRKPLGPSQPEVEIVAIGFAGTDILRYLTKMQLKAVQNEIEEILKERRLHPGG